MDSFFASKQRQEAQRLEKIKTSCLEQITKCQEEIMAASPAMRPVVVGRWQGYADQSEQTSKSGVFTKEQQAAMISTSQAIRRIIEHRP